MEHRDVTQKTDALWIQSIELLVETGMISDWVKNEPCRVRDMEKCSHATLTIDDPSGVPGQINRILQKRPPVKNA